MFPRLHSLFVIGFLLAPSYITAQASTLECGDFEGVFGPWDYYNPISHEPLPGHPMGPVKRVTNVHLKDIMFKLERGGTGAGPKGLMADLDYTLIRIPNHPQALHLLIRFDRKTKGKLPQLGHFTWKRTAECYFKRAIKFRPNISKTHLLYGLYFHKNGELEQAEIQYKTAESLGSKSVDLPYNMGLLYFENKDYALAKQYAIKAYKQGYPIPGLMNKLKTVGHWDQAPTDNN